MEKIDTQDIGKNVHSSIDGDDDATSTATQTQCKKKKTKKMKQNAKKHKRVVRYCVFYPRIFLHLSDESGV